MHHVTSKNIPADIVSRGLPAEELKGNFLWWHGPSFLRKINTPWVTTLDPKLFSELSKHSNTGVQETRISEERNFHVTVEVQYEFDLI